MKRIEFIAPVEAMRGNLSGTQNDLAYNKENGAGWDAEDNKKTTAKNYDKTYVGAKRSATGLKFFATKRKTSVKMTDASRLSMALLGASGVIKNILKKNLTALPLLRALYMVSAPKGWSFDKWLMFYIRQGLEAQSVITFPAVGTLSAVQVKNPYISTSQPSGAIDISSSFPQEILVKFWGQLSGGIAYGVNNLKGIANSAETFNNEYLESSRNLLNLVDITTIIGQTDTCICLKTWTGSQPPLKIEVLTLNGSVVKLGDAIQAVKYETVLMDKED